jgi:PhnB protein
MPPIPAGHHTVTPYLTVHGAAEAITLYTRAFGAVETRRITGDDGHGNTTIGFAELQIGDSRLMLSDEYADGDVYAPPHYGGTAVAIHLYVEDVDAWAARALEAGLTVVRPVADQDGLNIRNGIFECPFGHRWFITSVTG